MKEISRQTVAALQKDLDAAIKPLLEKYGLKVGDPVMRSDATKKYTITGATERSEKYDLTGKTDDGKEWRFSHRGLVKADGTPVVDAWAPKPTVASRPVTPSTEVR